MGIGLGWFLLCQTLLFMAHYDGYGKMPFPILWFPTILLLTVILILLLIMMGIIIYVMIITR